VDTAVLEKLVKGTVAELRRRHGEQLAIASVRPGRM
jgi:hypothetical protein